eukprot:TRINITY_DN12996_c0_g1_i1.p1 TRINITY_DN12996_c0_g1~~TRINITY_DN12996_c0_g1_i1.p1  ORF type:complete len:158 (-),score=20.94 TRINITY_DN12996_c0_g1_i1:84-557(-)
MAAVVAEHASSMEPSKAKRKTYQSPKSPKPGPQKPPTNAYQLFSAAVRDKLREENPTYSFGDMNKEVGIRWKNEKDKEKWEVQHANMLIDYWWALARETENAGGSPAQSAAEEQQTVAAGESQEVASSSSPEVPEANVPEGGKKKKKKSKSSQQDSQ